ncbi:MAG: sensor histidine kinase [Gammaproteobacteria bacterium]
MRLENAFQRERRFGADLAHELRTPISELRSLAEVALKWPEDAGGRAAFQEAFAVAHRMETIVAGLLTLVRCEDGKQAVAVAPVKVAELVEEIWSPLAERAQRKQLAVATEIPRAFCLETDRSLLRLILSNLLANTVDYTPAGGQLSIAASSRNGRFDLTVANTTDVLSPQDLPHLFERFWRKDAARTDSAHAGLGLSLASVSAGVLGMMLSAELADATTLRLVLSGSHTPT